MTEDGQGDASTQARAGQGGGGDRLERAGTVQDAGPVRAGGDRLERAGDRSRRGTGQRGRRPARAGGGPFRTRDRSVRAATG
jgi:hypothetical protein